jgi:acetoin utilization protein AcuB
MKIFQLMTVHPFTIESDGSLGQARSLMRQHLIHELPVMEDGTLVGIITLRDIELTLSASERAARGAAAVLGMDFTVDTVMSAPVQTVGLDTHISEAIRIFVDRRIHALPVVDEQGALVGILSVTDVLRAAQTVLDRA